MSIGLLSLTSTAPYEGLVAQRCRPYFTLDTTNKQIMGRSAHIATENLTSVRIAFGTAQNNVADFGVSATTTLKASIEYPAGTFVQLTWSAATSVVCADISLTLSDYVSVSIPSGATFWVRMFAVSTGGVFYNTWRNTFLGESVEIAATGLIDKTMSGTVSDSGNSFPPLGVLGITSKASVVIVGDSIGFGANDVEDTSASITGYNGKVGIIARSLGSVPFLNCSASTSRGYLFVSQATVRKLMIPKASHLISQYGTNDLSDSKTAAQIEAGLQGIYALARPGQRVMQSTIIPRCTDPGTPSAAFTTLGQQTAILNETDRLALNAAILAKAISGQSGAYDTNSVLESSAGSGKWLVTPSPPYTADGTHCSVAGYTLVQTSGIIPVPTA